MGSQASLHLELYRAPCYNCVGAPSDYLVRRFADSSGKPEVLYHYKSDKLLHYRILLYLEKLAFHRNFQAFEELDDAHALVFSFAQFPTFLYKT